MDFANLTVILDGVERAVPVPPGQTLMEAATAAGIELPSICRQGNCGSCAAVLLQGEVAMPECKGLSLRDRQAGMILACQAMAASDVLTISYDG
jgi:3-ketosteroid 9alpha-monooxygenase subunit B